MTRRVATGLDAAGKSCISHDDAVPMAGEIVGLAWATAALPADNLAPPPADPEAWVPMLHGGGLTFLHVRMPPGASAPLHATDTIDFITMISGEITIITETGEETVRTGELMIDRGVIHGWRNDGAVDAVYSVVTAPAHPVGAGRTVGWMQ